MSLLTRVRTRLSGFHHHHQTAADIDVDPHEWHLPKPSPSSLTGRGRHNRKKRGSSSSSSSDSDSSNCDDDEDEDAGHKKKNGKGPPLAVPDPEIFRNAFVPVFAAGDPARAVVVADGRLTYPDMSHAAVHLALLECFAALRRGVTKAPEGLSSLLDDNEEEKGEDEDDEAGGHEKRSSTTGSSFEGDDLESDDDDDDSSQKQQKQKRWDHFVRHAVVRFSAWWANIDKLLDHAIAYTPSYHHHPQPQPPSPSSLPHHRGGSDATLAASTEAAVPAVVVIVQLTSDYLPPLDVLLVWYAFMLAPAPAPALPTDSASASSSSPSPSPSLSPYEKACREHHHPALRNLCFPWPAIRDVIDISTSTLAGAGAGAGTGAEYCLPRAAAILFRTMTGLSAEIPPPARSPQTPETALPPAVPVIGEGGAVSVNGVEVDLVAAVHAHVDHFVARAADHDWLHGPPRTLDGALERAGDAYQEFLLRGGADSGEDDEEEGQRQKEIQGHDFNDGSGDDDGHDHDDKKQQGGDEAGGGDGYPQQLPFGISLMWRTHRLFPAQYRLFFRREREGEGKDTSEFLATLRRRMALGGLGSGPGATASRGSKTSSDNDVKDSNDQNDADQSKGKGGGEDACICECWTCERIRDEAPAWEYYGESGSRSSSSYDATLLRALSTEQLRSIQEDLGFYYALREETTGRRHFGKHNHHDNHRRRHRWRRGSDTGSGSGSVSGSHVPLKEAPPHSQQKVLAGRIFSKGVKAIEDRRRSWRVD